MRISNPKLFNGQTLVTKQQISSGLITIPSASISGLSELAAAISTNTTNISTISGALGTRAESLSGTAWGNISDIWGKLSELTGQDMTGGGLNLGSLDQRLTGVQTKITVPAGTYNYITSGDAVATNLTVLDAAIKNSITGAAIELVKDADPSGALSGYAAVYTLKQGSEQIGTINIPKDQFLKSAEYLADTNELKFVWHLADEDGTEAYDRETIVPVSSLVDTYTDGKGITITDNKIEADIADGLTFTGDTDAAKIAVKANAAKAIEVSADGVAVKVDGKTIVFADGVLSAVIPEVPVKSVSGGIGITETSTTGDVVLNLNAAKSDEIGGVKSGGDISVADDGTVSVLSARFADVAGKVANALTAFGATYDGSAIVTVSGKTGTEKYITYSQDAGVFTVGAQGLDVAADGNYVKTANTVAANLTVLDTNLKTVSGDLDTLEAAVGELSGKFEDIDHATLTIGSKTYNTSTDVTVTAADLGALTGAVAGNAGIEVSKTDGKVSISAVVKDGDLHLGIGTDGIETKGLTVADGNYVKTVNTVAENLTALDIKVKANADAIAANAEAIAANTEDIAANTEDIAKHETAIETAMQIVSVPLTAAVDKVEFDGVMCYSYAAPAETTYILQVTSGGMAVGADISGTTVYVDSTDLAAAPALSALIAKPVVIATTPAE